MFLNYIFRKLGYLSSAGAASHSQGGGCNERKQTGEASLSPKLQEAVENLKNMLGNGSDLKVHVFRFGPDRSYTGALLFFDGLVSSLYITQAILTPITTWYPGEVRLPEESLADILSSDVLCSGEVEAVQDPAELAAGCLNGDAALVLDGCTTGLVVNAKGWDKRSVAEPQSETVVRGPREGFTENILTNTALIRRKIKSGKLRSEMITVGRKTRTSVCIMYLDGVADQKVVNTVRQRVCGLEVDSILESGYIEEYIEDAPFSPFATIGYSEKPDVVAGRMLEGRVAIVVDGTPFVLTAPMLFIESFQSAEDYYIRPLFASLIRLLRFFSYLIAVFAPAIYIALSIFHQELIPTTLLFTVANAREGTPFPVFIEALIMVVTFEILREGGVRLPKPVGQAISIVGALVMGEAAVSAGIVGAPMVIVIAITAVTGFLIPTQYEAISIQRIAAMIASAFAGFYGIAMSMLFFLIHLSTLTSFGVHYFDGFAWTRNLQDSLVRMPLWAMVKRPLHIAKGDITRRHFFIPPLRPYACRDTESAGDNH